jgi:hypothetical protein
MIDELLLLVGRLDDGAGFDTPRERFRRFLLERVTGLDALRTLVDDCQRSVGEQRHRALQDLVVLAGRLLKFDITFGAYESRGDGLVVDGQWRSPGTVTVLLEIATEQTRSASLEGLARAVAALPPGADSTPRIGLCVVARQYAARGRLGHLLAADTLLRDIHVISIRSLLSLAELVVADRMSHQEVVTLIRSGFALDFVVGLLDRRSGSADAADAEADAAGVHADSHEPAFWVATITGTDTAAPARFLRSVIAHRRVLAVCDSKRPQTGASPGDWVCFFIPGQGIAGHAQLMSIVEDAASVVRHAGRFSRVYRLADVALYDEPIVDRLDTQRPFGIPPADGPVDGACLAPIAKRDFLSVTTYHEEADSDNRPRAATA